MLISVKIDFNARRIMVISAITSMCVLEDKTQQGLCQNGVGAVVTLVSEI